MYFYVNLIIIYHGNQNIGIFTEFFSFDKSISKNKELTSRYITGNTLRLDMLLKKLLNVIFSIRNTNTI